MILGNSRHQHDVIKQQDYILAYFATGMQDIMPFLSYFCPLLVQPKPALQNTYFHFFIMDPTNSFDPPPTFEKPKRTPAWVLPCGLPNPYTPLGAASWGETNHTHNEFSLQYNEALPSEYSSTTTVYSPEPGYSPTSPTMSIYGGDDNTPSDPPYDFQDEPAILKSFNSKQYILISLAHYQQLISKTS